MKRLAIDAILKKHHIKQTKGRTAILDVLCANSERLMSVEDIYQQVKSKENNINLTTVYRNLDIFDALGLVLKNISDDQVTYYKISCDITHHHHHLICETCGKTEIIDHCPMQAIEQAVKDKNFTIKKHTFEIYGICNKCGEQ